jgi:peptide/nickel transport system permease protein
MRLVDFMLALPGLLFAMVMVAGLGASVRTIVIVVVATSWVAYARYVRGEVLSQRERDYVTAALVTGCSGVRIMLRHLLPNVLATVLVIATLQTGGIILLVASLSFLGLGIPKPTAAWGVMIADGRAWLLQAWWISVFPGVAISLLIISLNLVGDWMRDTFDPRLRGAE